MTSKSLYWLALALLLSTPALAQTAPGWGWVRTFNDNTQPSPTSLSENRMAGVGRDAAGNLYVAGSFIGNLTIGPPPATSPSQDMDVFVAKYDPAGTLLWVRTLHSPGADVAMDIVVSPAGRCTVAGSYNLSSGGLSFAGFGSSLVLPPSPSPTTACGTLPFVAAINPDGSLAWASSPAPAAVCGLSTSGNDYYKNRLATDAQDNVYWTVTTPPVGATSMSGSREAALLKFNASGQVQWTRRAATAGQPGQSVLATSLQADQAGNLYWSVMNSDPFTLDNVTYGANSYNSLIKLATATNQVQWVKDDLFQVAATSGNYVPGYYTIAGIDAAAGNLYFWVPAWGLNIAYNGPGSPIVVPPNNQVRRFYLAQTDLNGQVQWVKLLANLTTTYPNIAPAPVSVYPSGNSLTVLAKTPGWGTVNFVGDATTYSAAQAGLVVVARFNPTTGQTEWVRTAGTDYGASDPTSQAGTTAINAVVDPTGNVYVAGLYYGPAHFGGTALGFTNSFSSYLAKLDQSVLPTRPAMLGKTWQPYPNPATGSVQLSGLPTGAQVSLLDALGRTVRRTTSTTLPLGGLAPGLYLLQVSGTPEPYQSQRLTVE
ncbi:MAG: T9SS type A sorting domain-containing protein [Janthinobacterium lividum]